jgi:FixJ family two-component response regulator
MRNNDERHLAQAPLRRYRPDEQVSLDAAYIRVAVAAGRSTKDIAEDLGLSPVTVRWWMRKTGFLRNRQDGERKPGGRVVLPPEEIRRRLALRGRS